MDLSQIMTFIESLGDTWFGEVLYACGSGFAISRIALFFISVTCFAVSFSKMEESRNISRYIEFSLLRDFPDYVKTEKSAKWLDKVRLWFIRNG